MNNQLSTINARVYRDAEKTKMNTTETKHTPDSLEFLIAENKHFRELIDRSLSACQSAGICTPLRVALSSALAHDAAPLNPVYASAPQLLAALQACQLVIESHSHQFTLEDWQSSLPQDAAALDQARAAIRQATGETI